MMVLMWYLWRNQNGKLIVETVETEQHRYFLRLLALQKCPVLFVGPTGTGKSAITNDFLLKLPYEHYITTNINFSAQTSALQTQDAVNAKLYRSVTNVCCIVRSNQEI